MGSSFERAGTLFVIALTIQLIPDASWEKCAGGRHP